MTRNQVKRRNQWLLFVSWIYAIIGKPKHKEIARLMSWETERRDYSKGYWLNAEWISYEKTVDVTHQEEKDLKRLPE